MSMTATMKKVILRIILTNTTSKDILWVLRGQLLHLQIRPLMNFELKQKSSV